MIASRSVSTESRILPSRRVFTVMVAGPDGSVCGMAVGVGVGVGVAVAGPPGVGVGVGGAAGGVVGVEVAWAGVAVGVAVTAVVVGVAVSGVLVAVVVGVTVAVGRVLSFSVSGCSAWWAAVPVDEPGLSVPAVA